MKLQRWNVVGVVVFGVGACAIMTATGGCTASASGSVGGGLVIGDFPNCTEDDSLDCSGGGFGITCPSGDSPDNGQYVCSDPSTMADGTDGFCCIDFSGSYPSGDSCAVDDSVTATCEYPSYGFTCTGSDSPDTGDSSLVCSEPGGNGMQYCCTDGSGGGSGGSSGSSGGSSGGTTPSCDADSSLSCEMGSTGYTCTDGATIASDDPTFICSDPTMMSDGSNGYCCIMALPSSSTCSQDDSVTGCQDPSIGFSCTGSDTPSDADSSLNCSTGTPDGSNTDYCCQ
jgi:hypothetical protein